MEFVEILSGRIPLASLSVERLKVMCLIVLGIIAGGIKIDVAPGRSGR